MGKRYGPPSIRDSKADRESMQMNPIPINDLARHAAALGPELRDAIERVINKNSYVLGAEVAAFEVEFAQFCGAVHCVAVANGTDALELAFRAVGIGPDSRVATVANAGCYSSTALALIGARPVYVDVDDSDQL